MTIETVPTTGVLWGDAADIINANFALTDKAYIILQSTSTQVMSTDSANPSVLDNWAVLKSNGMSLQGDSVRNDTGRTISLAHGTLGLHPQVDGGGGTRLLALASEYSDDAGVTYTLVNQLRPIYTVNNSESFSTKESYATDFLANRLVRFIAYADATMSLAPSSASFRGSTVTGPAMVWILVEA